MRSPAWLFWTFLVTYVVTFLPWAGVSLAYGRRSPWRSTATGRALFITFTSLAVVLGFSALVRIVHLPLLVLAVLGVVLLGAVQLAGWLQLVNVLRLQKESRRDRSNP